MILMIVALALSCYWPALHGAILWDDPAHLTSYELRSWSGLWRIWFDLGATQQYYPVVHSAFWIEHRLWGDSVTGYHLINVLLHAAACGLLAVILRRLWARSETQPSGTSSRNTRPGFEWLAAALFAVHPVCVESVAWISEQKNTLSLFFFLLAGLLYLNFAAGRRRRSYLFATLFFFLALGTKSVTAILPAAILVVLWWQNGRLSWRRDIVPSLPWFAASVLAGLFTAWVERKLIGAQGAPFDLTVVQRVLLASRDVWFYLGKLIWPADLTFFYPRWNVAAEALHWIGYLIAAMGVTAGFVWLRRRARGPLAAWLLFVGSVFPALGFFNVYPFIFSYVADHFQYIACAVAIAAAVGGMAWVANRPIAWIRTAVTALGIVMVLGLTLLSRAQSSLYRDVETLFRHTLASVPQSWMAHHNLGLALVASRDRGSEAIAEFQKAIALKPDFPESHFVLGRELMKQPNSRTQAVAELERAIELRPNYAEAHTLLGMDLAKQPGRLPEAITHFERALSVRPRLVDIHVGYANALATDPARLPEAIAHFEEALHLRPDAARTHHDYGVVLARVPGRRAAAIEHFERALSLEPDFAEAHYNLANVLAETPARATEAISHYEQALRLQPDSAPTHYGLANVLAFQPRRAADAVSHYQSAIRLQPGFAEAHANLANVLVHAPGRMAEAIEQYEAALRIDPRLAWVHFNLGLHLSQVPPRLNEAMAHFEEALRLKPDYTDALNGIAILYAQAGQLEEARAQWTKALAIDPNYRAARENLRMLDRVPSPSR